ncbi:MAG TPA: response regulator [Terriglobales bacterium]|nr:response regulator [Terriglobales bacterium]
MKMPEVLLVDDNPADVDLTSEGLARSECSHRINSVSDGAEAMAFLHREGKYHDAPSPALMILDLNLPRKDGRAVLAEVKTDPALRQTPVVIFSTSQAGPDIGRSYQLGANSYVTKPAELSEFFSVVRSIGEFWLGCACLPSPEES